ncbi:probable G-protein coupled receptor 148 [Salmo trutta]|uniref:probable G-protein coupled receptor 148 n=1 Tax=Salmo trutta TaxID=8032 RepID=UPI0011316DED|nr:probable G-protein coupled receptor 148 [Salmo trutta]
MVDTGQRRGRRHVSSVEMAAEENQVVLSLLCAFGTWYNNSGHAERHSRISSETSGNTSDTTNTTTNSFQRQVELFTREWHVFLPPRQSRAMHVCPILGFLAVSLVIPVILTRILTSPRMRQETRYLLLANALLSDMLFVSLYMVSACLNATGVLMSEWACSTILFLLGLLYCAGIFSTKAMVLDTSLAVMAPLRYYALWPVSRTRRAIAGIWAVSVFLPAASVGVLVWYHSTGPCSLQICSLPLLLVLTVSQSTPMQVSMLLAVTGVLLILLLVFSGYIVLYYRTRMSGVWRGERSSRAKGTFLIHYLHLILSFLPMLVLLIKLLLYCHLDAVDLRANLWVSLVVCNILLVLPKALAPYLYGLRYRHLCEALLAFYGLKRPTTVSPVM